MARHRSARTFRPIDDIIASYLAAPDGYLMCPLGGPLQASDQRERQRHHAELRGGERVLPNGPPGYPGEPYIPLAVSFAMTSGERRRQGHLDYALSRSFWEEQHPPTPTETDGATLCGLVRDRLPDDLREIDAGGDPEALRTNRTPKFLRR